MNDRYVAHRGLFTKNQKIPENSLMAFENALKYGLAIELDVHLTKDEKLVVVHDHHLKRITGKDLIVEESTLEELKKLYLFSTQEKIPTLEEVLKLINGKVLLIIEIKNKGKVGKLEENLLKVLKNYSGNYFIESFNPLSLLYFKRHAESIVRGQLCTKKIDDINSKVLQFVLSHMLFNIFTKPHFIAYDIKYFNEKIYLKTKRKNRKLFLWTIQNLEELKFAEKQSDCVIFNYSEEILQYIQENRK